MSAGPSKPAGSDTSSLWFSQTKETLKRAGGSKRVEFNATLFHRTLHTASVIPEDGVDPKKSGFLSRVERVMRMVWSPPEFAPE